MLKRSLEVLPVNLERTLMVNQKQAWQGARPTTMQDVAMMMEMLRWKPISRPTTRTEPLPRHRGGDDVAGERLKTHLTATKNKALDSKATPPRQTHATSHNEPQAVDRGAAFKRRGDDAGVTEADHNKKPRGNTDTRHLHGP